VITSALLLWKILTWPLERFRRKIIIMPRKALLTCRLANNLNGLSWISATQTGKKKQENKIQISVIRDYSKKKRSPRV